ncbi:MAG: S24/S26 family peptidase [Acidimicrobiia bacterium]
MNDRFSAGRILRVAGTLVVVAGWTIWFRPVALGGPAGYVVVSGTSMQPTLQPGDLVVVRHRSEYRAGDVVSYRVPSGGVKGARVIHRIIGGDPVAGFVLRGDNKPDADLWRPRPADIEGRQWIRIAGAGRVMTAARSPAVLAAAVGGTVFAFAFTWKPKSQASP